MQEAPWNHPSRRISSAIPKNQAHKPLFPLFLAHTTPNYPQHKKTPYNAIWGLSWCCTHSPIGFQSDLALFNTYLAQPKRRRRIFYIFPGRYSHSPFSRVAQIGFFRMARLCSVTSNTGTKSLVGDYLHFYSFFHKNKVRPSLHWHCTLFYLGGRIIFWVRWDVG